MLSLAQALDGGLLIHLAVCTLLLNNGSPMGFMGIGRGSGRLAWRETLASVVGMVASVFTLSLAAPSVYAGDTRAMSASLETVLCGVLMGWGTRNARGSLFEHLFVGLPLLSKSSSFVVLVALTSELMTTAAMNLLAPNEPSSGSLLHQHQATLSVFIPTVSLLTTITISSFLLSLSVHYGFRPTSGIRLAVALLSGLEYGCGLLVSGIITSKRQGTFTWNGFDLSLLVVAVTAILPSLARIYLRGLVSPPAYGEKFYLERFQKGVDARWQVVLGSIILGVGWGWDSLTIEMSLMRILDNPQRELVAITGYWAGSC